MGDDRAAGTKPVGRAVGGASAAAKNPRCGPVARVVRPKELGLEGAGHADPVFVHGETVVPSRPRETAVSHQVVLVGRVEHPPAKGRLERPCHRDRVDDSSCLGDGVGRIAASPLNLLDPGHGHRIEFGVLVEDARERVLEDGAVVDAGQTTIWPRTTMP